MNRRNSAVHFAGVQFKFPTMFLFAQYLTTFCLFSFYSCTQKKSLCDNRRGLLKWICPFQMGCLVEYCMHFCTSELQCRSTQAGRILKEYCSVCDFHSTKVKKIEGIENTSNTFDNLLNRLSKCLMHSQ